MLMGMLGSQRTAARALSALVGQVLGVAGVLRPKFWWVRGTPGNMAKQECEIELSEMVWAICWKRNVTWGWRCRGNLRSYESNKVYCSCRKTGLGRVSGKCSSHGA
jgi:hypothetical protein